jgi:hypothetical protein
MSISSLLQALFIGFHETRQAQHVVGDCRILYQLPSFLQFQDTK